MSGVCGVVDFSGAPVDPGLLRAMAHAAPHRGPDGTAFWSEGPAGLAHQALNSTPEAVREMLPIRCGELCLTADARIDNRAELIAELSSPGGPDLTTATDAGLILAAWRRWRTGAPLHLIGDFAFAVWDSVAKSLFLARDALGIRPLHYAVLPRGIVFASEAQQVLAHPSISRDIDERTVAEFLVGVRRDGARSAYRQVRRLLPGHMLFADAGGGRPERYWDPTEGPRIRHRRSSDYSDHYLEILRRAVRDRLRSSGPVVGIYLSGGLDSTAVAAVASSELSGMADGPRLVAQTFVFDEFSSCDERVHSGRVAEHCGITLERVSADGHPLLGDRMSLEGPEIGWEAAGREMRERFARRGARVVLTGHQRDFGVFGHDRACNLDRLFRGHGCLFGELLRLGRREKTPFLRVLVDQVVKPLLPYGLRRLLRRLRGHTVPARLPSWLPAERGDRYGLASLLAPPSGLPLMLGRNSPAARRRLLFLDDIGSVVYWHDRAEARSGIEARHPLLDRRLAEFFARIPPEEVWRPGPVKPLVRRAMAGLLPDSIRRRRDKTRFDEYICSSLRRQSGARIRDLLERQLLGQRGLVDAEELRRAWAVGESAPACVPDLWFPIAAELWLREMSDSAP